jgi:hypothetical protein
MAGKGRKKPEKRWPEKALGLGPARHANKPPAQVRPLGMVFARLGNVSRRIRTLLFEIPQGAELTLRQEVGDQ